MIEKPFRWDITRAAQLGSLIGDAPPEPAAIDGEMLPCCARIIAFSGNSDLVFVGRSPESFFDLLSGMLFDTTWLERLTLLHFSMRYHNESVIQEKHPQAIAAMRAYLESLGLSPHGIATRSRPVAFVDLVYSGETFSRLIMLLARWTREIRYDWNAVRRRIRLVGITSRTKNSPNTWRWQQQVQWMDLLEHRSVKNVSINNRFWGFLGNEQKKLTRSYHPAHWGKEALAHPEHDEKNIEALRYAIGLFEKGKTRECREQFITLLGRQPAIKEGWFRQLMQELRY